MGLHAISARHKYPTFDPNQELQHFVQALLLRREYEKPYELPPQMIRCADALVEQIQVDNEDQLVYSSQAKKLDMRVFEDALLQFYKSRSVTKVSWDDARENAELKSMAVEILQRANKDRPAMQKEISDLFRQATDKWLKAGYIYKEKQDDIYNVVDEEDLAKIIIRSIREMSKQLPDQLSGIRADYIAKAVIADERYSKLHHNSTIIDKVVDDLVEQSILYPTGYSEYKIFL
ncbi:unnamed protein product [Mucor fragilis]